ncbi:MAG: hypothetical protein OEY51_09920, partial [Cyclobacteriaceae bacterium]|nr:hypothetical protein [Cyclobacteriaceae bacterium]
KLVNSPNYHYCSSVHCAYYSCYLQLYHIIFVILTTGKNDFNLKKKQWFNSNKGGIHNFSIMFVYDNIDNVPIKSNFKNKIYELKKLRVQSDYENVSIGFEVSKAAITLANEITKLLSTSFNYAT